MAGKYVEVDVSELRDFCNKLHKAGQGGLKKELATFLDGAGFELLRLIQDEIIRLEAVDTRLLLNSFQKEGKDNIYVLDEGGLTLEIGTNVDYASYVNDGHMLNPEGVERRFVPGYWDAQGRFVYQPGAKTGMLLKQKHIEGKHYMESAMNAMEKLFPGFIEAKLEGWVNSYF